MKSRLWPAVFFAVALASLPFTNGCGDNELTKADMVDALCAYAACDDPETVAQCQLNIPDAFALKVSQQCYDELLLWADICPDRRADLPPSCIGVF